MKNLWTNHQQRAIARAYARFSERYPGWSEALFDQHFLYQRLRLLLEGGLTLPDATGLASWWANHIGLSEASRARWMPDLVPAACVFLELLRAELSPHPAQRKLAASA